MDFIGMNNRRIDNKKAVISALIIVLLYLSVVFSIYNKIAYIMSLAGGIGIISFYSWFHKEFDNRFKLQLLVVDIFLAVFFLGVFLSSSVRVMVDHYSSLIVASVMLFCSCRILLSVKNTLISSIRKNRMILTIAALLLFVLVPILFVYPIWDAAWYIGPISEVAENFDLGRNNSFFDLYLVNHVSAAYSLLFILGKFFCPTSALGIMVIQIILFEIAVLTFYGSLPRIVPGINLLLQCILTCVFAFSPFMCGIVSDINLDFGIICFFCIFLFCYMHDLRLLSGIMAFVFVFTKETAIIIFSGFLFGAFVVEVIKAIKKEYSRWLHVITMGIPLLVWLFFYLTHGGWGDSAQSSAFAYDYEYVMIKLKQIFVLNFNWLFWLLIILIFAIRIIMRRCTFHSFEIALPIVSAFCFYFAFNVLFQTVVHARYVSFTCVVLSILFALNLGHIKGNMIKLIMSGMMACVLMIQSFINIDPLTLKVFPKYNVGSGEIVTMFYSAPSDALIYNREYIHYSKVLEKLLKDAGYDNDSIVFFSSKNISRYSLEGNRDGLLWNTEKNGFGTEIECQKIRTLDVEEPIESIDVMDGRKAICIVAPFGGMAIDAEEFENVVDIDEEISATSGKWKFTAYVGKVK